jgi:hypothetical protein
MALAIREMLPQFLRLLSAMKGESGDPAQIGMIKPLIANEKQLKRAVTRFGAPVPEASWYFKREYFPLSTQI